MSASVVVRLPEEPDLPQWARLRSELWPERAAETLDGEMALLLENVEREVVFLAEREGEVVGFLEASLRDGAVGARTSPVGYVEGWFVVPEARRRGIGSRLLAAAERWAHDRGALEMAAGLVDADAETRSAQRRLGYREVARMVHFVKDLAVREEPG